jgi:integrase
MILVAYRHGLRASELCDLQWHQVELGAGLLHVRRAKNGTPSVHPMQGDEIRALRRLRRENGPSAHVFLSERGGPMTPKSFYGLFARIGERARMPFPVHPHQLRDACGSRWLTKVTTRAHCRPGSDTRTSSTRPSTPSCRRPGSGISGVSERPRTHHHARWFWSDWL